MFRPWLAPTVARGLFFKCLLNIGIGLGGNGANLSKLHSYAKKKLPNLRWASLDPSKVCNRGLRFSYRAGRFSPEVLLDCLSVLVQLALRPLEGHPFEGLHSSLNELVQVRPQGVLRDVSDPTDLVMRQFACFQPDRPHLLLNSRMWMMQAFILDGFNRLGGERDSKHTCATSHSDHVGQENGSLGPHVV